MPLVKKVKEENKVDDFSNIMMWAYVILAVVFSLLWFVMPMVVKGQDQAKRPPKESKNRCNHGGFLYDGGDYIRIATK
jgi:heme/copper-type cytochrome/quinol oxidase subunit 2